jgi:hypothetical protein
MQAPAYAPPPVAQAPAGYPPHPLQPPPQQPYPTAQWQAAPPQQSTTYQPPQWQQPMEPPPQAQQPPPPQQTYLIPPPKSGLPPFLVVLIVAAVLIGLGYIGITFLRPGSGSSAATTAKADDKSDNPPNPYAKSLEIAGLRVIEGAKQKLQVQMVVINHSNAELPPLKLHVSLRLNNGKADQEPISTFDLKLPSIGPFDSREVKAEAVTKLRAYEFPDWQFLKADFEVAAP